MYTISESHFKFFEDFITEATECQLLIVLMIDDFTAIHTEEGQRRINRQRQRQCIVVKAFEDIPAVPVKQALSTHDQCSWFRH